jgi:hypothetical protein
MSGFLDLTGKRTLITSGTRGARNSSDGLNRLRAKVVAGF